MKYTVIFQDNIGTLIDDVNKHIVEDWKCMGGISSVSADPRTSRIIYCQAMVKEEYVNPTDEKPLEGIGEKDYIGW